MSENKWSPSLVKPELITRAEQSFGALVHQVDLLPKFAEVLAVGQSLAVDVAS